MGINFSFSDLNNVFKVENVNARSENYLGSQLHLSNKELILNFTQSPSLKPIRWPLNSIRRFGHYKKIFVIECKLFVNVNYLL